MTFQSVPDCASAAVQFVQNGEPFFNILNFAFLSGGYTQSDIDGLATGVDEWAGTILTPHLGGDCSYVQTVVRGLELLNDLTATVNTEAGAGGIAGVALPANIAFAVKFGSGLTGRSARGRAYVGGISDSQLGTNENFVASGAAGQWVADFETINAHIPTGWRHAIVSRFSNGVKRTTGVYFQVTSYSYTDLRVDSRRDRLP